MLLAGLRIFIIYIWFNVASLITLIICMFRPFDKRNDWIFGKFVGGSAMKILGVTYEVDHPEWLDRSSKVIIANHQDSLDVFVLSHLMPQGTRAVGKKTLLWVPIFGQLFWLAGNFLINRGHHASALGTMDKVRDSLVNDEGPVFILPEGTRSRGKGLGKFKKGAFHVAIAAQAPIVAIVAPHFHKLVDIRKWKSAHIKINILPPFSTKGLTADDVDQLMAKVHKAYCDLLGPPNAKS